LPTPPKRGTRGRTTNGSKPSTAPERRGGFFHRPSPGIVPFRGHSGSRTPTLARMSGPDRQELRCAPPIPGAGSRSSGLLEPLPFVSRATVGRGGFCGHQARQVPPTGELVGAPSLPVHVGENGLGRSRTFESPSRRRAAAITRSGSPPFSKSPQRPNTSRRGTAGSLFTFRKRGSFQRPWAHRRAGSSFSAVFRKVPPAATEALACTAASSPVSSPWVTASRASRRNWS